MKIEIKTSTYTVYLPKLIAKLFSDRPSISYHLISFKNIHENPNTRKNDTFHWKV